jgi:hypothetical protein
MRASTATMAGSVISGVLASACCLTYRPERALCGPDGVCAMPRSNRIGKVMLWLAAVVVVLSTTVPWYAEYLPF